MESTTLRSALSNALGTDTSSGSAAFAAETTAASSRTIRSYGQVDSTDYDVLLRLTPAVNLWQHIALAATSWDAANAGARTQIDAAVIRHLHTSLDLYRQAHTRLTADGITTQLHALEYDTATSGANEVARLLDVLPGANEGLTTRALFDRINRRIDSLCRAFMRHSRFREVEWRLPAIASHLPVFHLEFGEQHLELRCSVVI